MKPSSSYKKIKKSCFTKNKPSWVFTSLLFILIFVITPSHANTINTQRQDYLEAKKAFELKQYKKFGRIANTLKDYPLYPYLRYNYLRKRVWKEKNSDIIYFLDRYSDLPVTNRLRNSWLKVLIRRGPVSYTHLTLPTIYSV